MENPSEKGADLNGSPSSANQDTIRLITLTQTCSENAYNPKGALQGLGEEVLGDVSDKEILGYFTWKMSSRQSILLTTEGTPARFTTKGFAVMIER